MRKKAMEVFGSNFDEIIIGGAPFNAEVERFLKQIGFPYTIAYGMTECGPIICSSRWETLKLASCGKATTRMEVKIDSPDPQNVAGEIICKGANLMLGYYKKCRSDFPNHRCKRLAAHRRPCNDGYRRICHCPWTQQEHVAHSQWPEHLSRRD